MAGRSYKSITKQVEQQGGYIGAGENRDTIKLTLRSCPNTLAVQSSSFHSQAHESIADLPLVDSWAEKHRHFVKWKHTEAKVCSLFHISETLYSNKLISYCIHSQYFFLSKPKSAFTSSIGV